MVFMKLAVHNHYIAMSLRMPGQSISQSFSPSHLSCAAWWRIIKVIGYSSPMDMCFFKIASYHIIMHEISASVSLNNEWQVGDAQPYPQDPTILRILLLRRRLIAYYLSSPPFSDEKHGLGLVGADSPPMWVRDHRLIMPNTLNPLAQKFSL